jgi:hypothetical protein
MLSLGPIGFGAPWLLLGLLALPVLWWLLRALPPAPARRAFAAVTLLLGLRDDESEPRHTPWWLLLVRALAIAALILGLAGPVLNPADRGAARGPLLIVMDASWASAQDWTARQRVVADELDAAARAGRPVAVVMLTDPPPGPPLFQDARDWETRIAALAPNPWEPDPDRSAAWLATLPDTPFDTVWLSDGLARADRDAVMAGLDRRGRVRVIEGAAPRLGLSRPFLDEGQMRVTVLRAGGGAAMELQLIARGPNPAGVEEDLGRVTVTLDAGATEAEALFDLPLELTNRVDRVLLAGIRSAGTVGLTDDSLRRRKIGLYEVRTGRERSDLLAPLFYLERALEPSAEIAKGSIDALLLSDPDAIVLADVVALTPAQATALQDWVEAGGLLIRFAGPRLAAAAGQIGADDPLLPVPLRAGGRSVGGAMSWGEQRALQPFPDDSPFAGLTIPEDVTVSAQVLAQPGPELSERTWAALDDGTPLVTAKPLGQGRVVLFHVTANADWSTLPLSGLFVRMLDRLALSGGGTGAAATDLETRDWTPVEVLDGFGSLRPAGSLTAVSGARLGEGRTGPDMPPGLYTGGDASYALPAIAQDRFLEPAAWPAGTDLSPMDGAREAPLQGAFLAAALLLLALDILATLAVTGRLGVRRGPRSNPPTRSGRPGNRRTGLLPDALLAVTPDQPLPFGRGLCQAQRLSAHRGHDPVRHPRRGYRRASAPRAPTGASCRRWPPARHSAAGAGAADHVLTRTFYLLQDFPGRHGRPRVWVEAAPPMPNRSRACRSATSMTA